MGSKFLSLDEASKVLTGTGNFLVAADERVLTKLPKGNWIGGTIPYFVADQGGTINQDKVFITEMPAVAKLVEITKFSESDIKAVYSKIPRNGFGVIILPAFSPIHLSFSINAPNFEKFAVSPLVGWISGLHLGELGKKKPLVMNGKTGAVLDADAIVMYFELPKDHVCDLGIVNIFKQGNKESFEFLESGFSAKDVLISGKKTNFCDFLIENKVDVKNPLVANYAGAMINVSFQSIDEKAKVVHFYAPVYKGAEYKLADAVPNYVESFTKSLPKDAHNIAFSCNCILNFLYSELEGKKTGSITGPITFGEVAYQLLNQTMVYLTIEKI
jgi:hypothetical protein